ncbi:BTB/POZ and MATH domain-containing protein 2 [Triticum urartu]|uniref:BTB/POZ and MATH domain-containing protein 2 n=1 Tax=Triticum urartu TaxID=4572 RepID=M7Y661_TRIUA|nr:BTB/POZ and MATH domain-containing protein 2 [Triticum urartu]
MASFAGVSVLDDGGLCPATESPVEASADCGYHLLVVQDYSGVKQRTPTGESVASRPFMVGGHHWIIKYYPNGESQSCADFISLYVSRLNDDDDDDHKKPVEAKFGLNFVDQVERQNPVYFSQAETYNFIGSSWGQDKFIRKDALERSLYLRGNCFTIRCDIMVFNTKDDADGRKVLLPDICHDFNILFQTEVGADVKFEIGGDMIDAHRCVLAARSKVFMAQLFGPMKETSSVIQIKDMDAKVFGALLRFIYTDSFPEMLYDNDMETDKMPGVVKQEQEERAAEDKMSEGVQQGQEEEVVEDEMRLQWLQDLLVAADRYDVQRLKFICEKQLSEHINVSSVMSTLALAEQHRCCGLKEACFKFIQVQSPSCLQEVMDGNGWDYVLMTYPSVFKELVAKLASNQRK